MVEINENETVIELRSDTFTKPSKKMLNEILNAEVGDSVYDEDPTVKSISNKIYSFKSYILILKSCFDLKSWRAQLQIYLEKNLHYSCLLVQWQT